MNRFEIIADEIKLLNNVTGALLISDKNYLTPDISDFVLKKSKKLRSGIAFCGILSLGLSLNEKVIRTCAITELIHNASLIHDDVTDKSEIRRGQNSFYKTFGAKTAVIAGDYLLSVILDELADINIPEITKCFALTVKKLCTGEINQNLQIGVIPSIPAYVKKSRHKTAELFKTGMFCALKASEPPKLFGLREFFTSKTDKNFTAKKKNLCDFALNFGIAYQIYDDITNFVPTTEKPFQNDFEQGIYTAPAIFFAKDFPDIDFAQISPAQIYKSDAMKKSANLCEEFISKALENLTSLDDNPYKSALVDLCKDLTDKLKNV